MNRMHVLPLSLESALRSSSSTASLSCRNLRTSMPHLLLRFILRTLALISNRLAKGGEG